MVRFIARTLEGVKAAAGRYAPCDGGGKAM